MDTASHCCFTHINKACQFSPGVPELTFRTWKGQCYCRYHLPLPAWQILRDEDYNAYSAELALWPHGLFGPQAVTTKSMTKTITWVALHWAGLVVPESECLVEALQLRPEGPLVLLDMSRCQATNLIFNGCRLEHLNLSNLSAEQVEFYDTAFSHINMLQSTVKTLWFCRSRSVVYSSLWTLDLLNSRQEAWPLWSANALQLGGQIDSIFISDERPNKVPRSGSLFHDYLARFGLHSVGLILADKLTANEFTIFNGARVGKFQLRDSTIETLDVAGVLLEQPPQLSRVTLGAVVADGLRVQLRYHRRSDAYDAGIWAELMRTKGSRLEEGYFTALKLRCELRRRHPGFLRRVFSWSQWYDWLSAYGTSSRGIGIALGAIFLMAILHAGSQTGFDPGMGVAWPKLHESLLFAAQQLVRPYDAVIKATTATPVSDVVLSLVFTTLAVVSLSLGTLAIRWRFKRE